MCMRKCVCMCECGREREREREGERERVRKSAVFSIFTSSASNNLLGIPGSGENNQKKRERECVCVRERERESPLSLPLSLPLSRPHSENLAATSCFAAFSLEEPLTWTRLSRGSWEVEMMVRSCRLADWTRRRRCRCPENRRFDHFVD